MPTMLRSILALALAATPAPALLAQMAVGHQGVHFPDGTLQTTAAAAPVVAWPQQSHMDIAPLDQFYPIFSGDIDGLPGHPGGWSGFNGVPEGWYFLVTDVMITPPQLVETIDAMIRIYHIGACDNQDEGGSQLRRLAHFRLPLEPRTLATPFESPLFVIPPGDCIRVDGFASNSNTLRVAITGYLTAEPWLFHP